MSVSQRAKQTCLSPVATSGHDTSAGLERFRRKSANVCHLWTLSNPRRGFLTTFHRSAQFAALDDENWALMAPSCSSESRGGAKMLTKILFRDSSHVLSPGKAISPSVRTIITAVFIRFLFVLMGLLNIIFVCVLHKGFRMLWNRSTLSQRRVKSFLLLS